MRACWRCHVLSETVTQRGLLWLCEACQVLATCAPFQHAYVGSEQAGTLVCLTCGRALIAGALSTAVVPAPSTDAYVDC
jgi:hypothetical protein